MNSKDDDWSGGDDPETADIRTFSQVKDRVEKEHKVSVEHGDPAALVWAMHGILLEDLQAALKGTTREIEAILGEAGEVTAAHVRECLNVLKDETLNSSLRQTLQQTLARVAQEAANAATVQTALVRLRNQTYLMVALSWLALFLNIFILTRS